MKKSNYSNCYDFYFQKYSLGLFAARADWCWFKAMAYGESALNPEAVSLVNALGVMQLMPNTLTDVQRVARYLFLQKFAFGGHITGQTFGTSTTGKPRFNLLTLESTIERAWLRLIHVQREKRTELLISNFE